MHILTCSVRRLIGVLLLGITASVHGAEPAGVAAIWKPVEIQFSYNGLTTHYSCDGLEWKVAQILKVTGAHEKTRVSARGCPSNGPSRQAFVHISGAIPVAAGEAKAVPAKDDSRQALLNRLGVKPEIDQDAFPAIQKTIDVSREPSVALEPGDCELLEQLVREVFPALGMKVVQSTARCTPGQVSISTPRLQISALVKAPAADDKKP